MKGRLIFVGLVVGLWGCGPAEEKKVEAATPKPIAQKKAEPTIGDGSPIGFKHNEGMRKGDGEIVQGGQTTKIQFMTYALKEDGTAVIKVEGAQPPELTFNGTWKKKDDKAVELELKEAKGTLKYMDAENPYELALSGDQFQLKFRASE